MYSELRMPFVADLKPKFTFFSLLGSLTLLRTLQSRDILIFDLFCTGEHEKNPSNMLLHTLAKLQKFSVHTGLDAQTAQNADLIQYYKKSLNSGLGI